MITLQGVTPKSTVVATRKHCQVWETLQSYKLCEDFPRDILSGISVGIMHIPQSMAYSLLATLPPICGLYTALFAPLVYIFLGTSKHLSMGAITVVSLMMAAVLDRKLDIDGGLVSDMINNSSPIYGNGTISSLQDQKVEIAVAISFVSGAMMILLGKVGLGVVTTYMSEPLISAFTSGVAVHVLVSQMKNILGLKIRRHNGMFKIFKTLVEVFQHITDTNLADVLTSSICILLLYLVKVQVNHRFRAKLHIPIPVELIVIILGTVASYFLRLETTYGVEVVGSIPAGLPTPRLPNFSVVRDCITDALLIGIVAFGQSVSMAKILARRNNYTIKPNQEMVAYGAGSMVCAVFSGYITAGSVARSLVQETTGGRTQIASIFSCVVVFVVIMAVGPLFFALPQCVLSSVILVALRSMFLQIRETKQLWKTSKYDLSIWVVTYVSVVVLDADIGLALGIVFSLLTVVIRTQRVNPVSIGRVGDTNNYKSKKLYKEVKDIQGVKIVSYPAPLYFANVDNFLENVSKCLEFDLEKEVRRQRSLDCEPCPKQLSTSKYKKNARARKHLYTFTSQPSAGSQTELFGAEEQIDRCSTAGSVVVTQAVDELLQNGKDTTDSAEINPTSEPVFSTCNLSAVELPFTLMDTKITWKLKSSPSSSSFSSSRSDETLNCDKPKVLIFDMSKVFFVDIVGVKTLKELIMDCYMIGMDVLVAECNDDVLEVFKTSGYWDDFSLRLFVSLRDAEETASRWIDTPSQDSLTSDHGTCATSELTRL
ncbi:prestin-like [Liolophura sinensis]|uniref:prestin-like n=1 Tax=Liolophura sinensis TaxID=3198878 RepID=UPI00315969FA